MKNGNTEKGDASEAIKMLASEEDDQSLMKIKTVNLRHPQECCGICIYFNMYIHVHTYTQYRITILIVRVTETSLTV